MSVSDHPTPRVLLVDSSRMVRRVAGRILRDLGMEVLEAATSGEGRDQCRLHTPNAVLVDPEGSPALIAELRALSPGSRMIACSADRSPRAMLEALEAGADEYVMKPFDSDILASKLALVGLGPHPAGRAA